MSSIVEYDIIPCDELTVADIRNVIKSGEKKESKTLKYIFFAVGVSKTPAPVIDVIQRQNDETNISASR